MRKKDFDFEKCAFYNASSLVIISDKYSKSVKMCFASKLMTDKYVYYGAVFPIYKITKT